MHERVGFFYHGDTFFHTAWQAWNLGRAAIQIVIASQQRIINTALRVISANLSAVLGSKRLFGQA